MRYDIRPDLSTPNALLLLSAPSAALLIFWWLQWGFNIWVTLGAIVVVPFAYVINEMYCSLTTYVILHPSHLDIRQNGWRLKSRFYRQRIHYSDILRLRIINDRELEVVCTRRRLTGDPSRDMEALVFQPRNPHAVAIDLQGRVEHALATPQS